MANLGVICGALCVMTGLGTLFFFGIFVVGFNTIVKIAVPIAVGGLPLNHQFQLWSAIPIATAINVSLTKAFAINTPINGSLATGRMEFDIYISDEDWDQDEFYPILYLEEGGELGDIERGVQVYSEGQLNYAKPMAIMFGVGSLGFAGFVAILACIVRKPG